MRWQTRASVLFVFVFLWSNLHLRWGGDSCWPSLTLHSLCCHVWMILLLHTIRDLYIRSKVNMSYLSKSGLRFALWLHVWHDCRWAQHSPAWTRASRHVLTRMFRHLRVNFRTRERAVISSPLRPNRLAVLKGRLIKGANCKLCTRYGGGVETGVKRAAQILRAQLNHRKCPNEFEQLSPPHVRLLVLLLFRWRSSLFWSGCSRCRVKSKLTQPHRQWRFN